MSRSGCDYYSPKNKKDIENCPNCFHWVLEWARCVIADKVVCNDKTQIVHEEVRYSPQGRHRVTGVLR